MAKKLADREAIGNHLLALSRVRGKCQMIHFSYIIAVFLCFAVFATGATMSVRVTCARALLIVVMMLGFVAVTCLTRVPSPACSPRKRLCENPDCDNFGHDIVRAGDNRSRSDLATYREVLQAMIAEAQHSLKANF